MIIQSTAVYHRGKCLDYRSSLHITTCST